MDWLPLELRTHIDRNHIHEGQLFGAVPAEGLSADDHATLERLGWQDRPYQDRPVLTPPESTVEWDRQKFVFRDNMLHAVAHRLPQGIPVIGNAEAIMEELVASTWEQREEQLRTVLGAFAFASLLSEPQADRGCRVEDAETFYFYTAAMKHAAERALAESVKPPEDHDEIWSLVEALADAPF